MASLAVGSHADKCIKAESNEQVTEQDCVVLAITTASSQEGLHRVPHLHFLSSWRLEPLKWNQAHEPRRVQGRVKNPVSEHGLNQAHGRLVHTCLSVISFSKNLDESLLMRWSDLFILGPPIVGVLKELLQGVLIVFRLQLLLLLDLLLSYELTLEHVRDKVEVELQDTEASFMSEVYGLHFGVDLHRVAVEQSTPVDVLCANNDWLLVSPMPKNGEVDRLVELEHQARVKLATFAIELEDESLIEADLTGTSRMLSVEPVLQKAGCDRNILIISWVHEIHESSPTHDIA